jgi:hypothetical protein
MSLKKAWKPVIKDFILTLFIIIILDNKQQPEPYIITPLIKPLNKPILISFESSYSLEPLLTTNDTEDTHNIKLTI